MTTLTITIPGELSPTTLGPLTEHLEHAVQSVIGADCEIQPATVTLGAEDARVAGYAMITALRMHRAAVDVFGLPELRHASRIHALAVRLLEQPVDVEPLTVHDVNGAAEATGDLTRPHALTVAQEAVLLEITDRCGRSHVRPLEDGAVEITGLLDDIEHETVCIEPDGTERWRS